MTTAARDPATSAIAAALSQPFDPREVKFKPQMVKNNKALAIAYIDARLVQERLDTVVGTESWQDSYDVLQDGSVVCRLAVRFPGHPEWVTKTDVGSLSEQPDAGDRLKAAFSDALKRAAVKFGIGRYLSRIPAMWVDYDPAKKQLLNVPKLPDFAIPRTNQQPSAKAPATSTQAPASAPPPAPAPKPEQAPATKPTTATPPASGAELKQRVVAKGEQLARDGLAAKGELVAWLLKEAARHKLPARIEDFDQRGITWAIEAVKAFVQQKANPPQGAA
jgi:hypothetical protein